jgi:dolichol-phosphate mannosyltransferase
VTRRAGSLSNSLTSRCRGRSSWCSRPFLFPGGTAKSGQPDLDDSKSVWNRNFRKRHLLHFIGGHRAHATNHRSIRPSGSFTYRCASSYPAWTALAQRVGHRYPKLGRWSWTAIWLAPGAWRLFVSGDELAVFDPSAPVSVETSSLLISLATYNEAGNLESLVSMIRGYVPDCSIVVIDDNSPDGTGQIADTLSGSLPKIDVIHRAGKEGLGTAMLLAMRYAIASNFEYMINLDADFSHPPRFIPALLDGMRDHDVMIGSRYVPGGGVEGEFNLKRKLMSSGINSYARLMLGLTSRDNSGSYRCYRVSKLAEINLDQVRSRGYSFQEEILFWCLTVGCRIGETPILFENRRSGVSKINLGEATSALWTILALGLARATGRIKDKKKP